MSGELQPVENQTREPLTIPTQEQPEPLTAPTKELPEEAVNEFNEINELENFHRDSNKSDSSGKSDDKELTIAGEVKDITITEKVEEQKTARTSLESKTTSKPHKSRETTKKLSERSSMAKHKSVDSTKLKTNKDETVPEKRSGKPRTSDASVKSIKSLNKSSTHKKSVRSSHESQTLRMKSLLKVQALVTPTPRTGIWEAKKRMKQPTVEIVKKPEEPTKKLLDSDVEDMQTDESVEEETEEEMQVDEIIERNAIMDMLRQIPDINDISETSSVDLRDDARQKAAEKAKERAIERERYELEGHFVERAAEESETTSSTADGEEKVEKDSTMEPKDQTEYSSGSTLSFSSTDSFGRPGLHSVTSVGNDDIAGKMTKIDLQHSNPDLVEYADTSALEQKQMASDLCELFLDDLIEKAVEYCEEDSVRLQRVLDKKKLMAALIPLYQQYEEEKYYKMKLQQLLKDYYLRKKNYTLITKSQYDIINRQRYHSGIIELDRLLALKRATETKCRAYTARLREDAEIARIYSEQKIADLEKAVRETLITHEHFDRLEGAVNNSLKSMSRVRNEISEMRLELINAQHRLAEMETKSESLETLGGGLHMREYLTNQSDVQLLSAKIAERNSDMDRLHLKINFDIHALAHLKCKDQMSRQTLNLLKTKLKEREETSLKYRDLIYQGKLKHNKLHRELDKIKTSGSLIYYPDLMKDYDITVKTLSTKRETVTKLRAQQNRLVQRIALAESYLNSRSRVSSIRSAHKISQPKLALPSELTVTKLPF